MSKQAVGNFRIMCRELRKGQKRAPFQDVVESIWEQMDELGHDLDNAVLLGPSGSTPRQVLLAVRRVESRQK